MVEAASTVDVDRDLDGGWLGDAKDVHLAETTTVTADAEADDGEPLFGTPQKSPEPNLVLVPIHGKADPSELLNQPVQLTFMTDMGAFEVVRPVTGLHAD